ncbi:TrgA family protein [Gemmobacter caeruleus]|uniref:TrgA family protein n=1 Tax=Gemmobacter caeruleus TaxID=2595004 RepID=UPI0011EBF1FF|nr:TrgA family protein [Gemmobacter caeruleus]
MPTAGKLAGAILFAVLAYVLAVNYRAELPLDYVPNAFYIWCVVIGLLCGWRVMGTRAGLPAREAPSSGILTVVITVLVAVLFFSTQEMLRRSANKLYKGPLEAVVGIFEIAAHYIGMMATPAFFGTMMLGGVACGMLAGMVGRRWP